MKPERINGFMWETSNAERRPAFAMLRRGKTPNAKCFPSALTLTPALSHPMGEGEVVHALGKGSGVQQSINPITPFPR